MQNKPVKASAFKAKPDLNSFINGGAASVTGDKPVAVNEPVTPVVEVEVAAPVESHQDESEVEVSARYVKPVKERNKRPKKGEAETKEDVGDNKIIFSLNDEDFESFRNFAFDNRVTKTSVIRKALKAYIKSNSR